MERHAEIVRQWRILLALEGRARALTLQELQQAAGEGVSERTIRRDLNALAQAGFPIEPAKVEGKTRYALNREVFGGLASAGFSLSELCALYLSRTMLSALAGGPFHDSLTSAFDKLTDALPPALWRFIDQLPLALAAKAPTLRATSAAPRMVDSLMSAILAHRRVRMRYHSFASQQVKDYVVEPYRVAYAQGTLYLFAFVPAYGEMRTFAVQRVEDVDRARGDVRSEGGQRRRVSRFAVGVLRHTGARRGGVLVSRSAVHSRTGLAHQPATGGRRPAAACG